MKLKKVLAAVLAGILVIGSSPIVGGSTRIKAATVTLPDMVTNSAAAQPSKGIELTEEGISMTFTAKMTTTFAWDSPQFAVYSAEDDTAKTDVQVNPAEAEGTAAYFRGRCDNYAFDATGNRWETDGKPLANGNSFVFAGAFTRGEGEATSHFTIEAYLLDGSAVITMENETFKSVSRVAVDSAKKNYLTLIANYCDITDIQYTTGAYSYKKLDNVASGAESDKVEMLNGGTTVLSYTSTTDAEASVNWLTPIVYVYNGDKTDPIAKIRSDCYDDVNGETYRETSFGGEWGTWLTRNKQGTGCFAIAKIEDDKLIVTVGDNTFGSTSTFPSTIVDVSKPIYLELHGNGCALSDINVSDISTLVLDKTEVEVNKGATAEVTVAEGTLPADATISGAVSSDDKIASVEVQGGKVIVTGVAGGNAQITVTGSNGREAEVAVSVNVPLTSIAFESESAELVNKKVKDTDNIQYGSASLSKIIFTPADTTDDKSITYTSSAPNVVKVDEKGMITAVAEEGTADITATVGDKTAICKVTVKTELVDSIVLAESVSISPTEKTIKVDETVQLKATVLPENVSNGTCTWTSSDPKIAEVDASGLVTGKTEGKVTITATTNDTAQKTATCEITVSKEADVPTTTIALNKTALDLEVDETADLEATITPETAADKGLTWTSSDETVAKVENGKVTALKEGTTKITVTLADDSEIKAECTVTVKAKTSSGDNDNTTAVTGISLNKKTLELEIGKADQLTATITPSTATNKEVEWKSDDATIATVDATGKVTAVKAGKTKIHATSKADSKFSAECEVTVKEASGNQNQNTVEQKASITLSASNVTLYTGKVGNSTVVKPTVQGASKAVTWTSSNKKIATVTNGTIKAVKKGAVTITATANGVSATVKVIVKDPSIKVKKGKKAVSKVTVKRKKSVKLTVTVSPAKSGLSLAKISTKNKKIAKVTLKGGKLTIKGKKKGSFSIKVKSGKATKTLKVKVK